MSVLRSICPICQTSEKLLRCQGCMAMLYCCQEHQIADRNNHKVACRAVKEAKITLEREERELRATPPGFMLPANVFETGVGKFYEIFETRGYMRARYSLVHKLVKIKTYDAVKDAFANAMDMLRLCPLDHLGVRLMVPALFIRLGKDQECYDFIKWYTSRAIGLQNVDDWLKMPYLDVNGADVFEHISTFNGLHFPVQFAVAVLLIKMRLLKDVQSLENTLFMYDQGPLPPELVDRIRKEAIVGQIVSMRRDIFKSIDQKPLIATLEEQIEQLFAHVQGYEYFWPGLLNPEYCLAVTPARYIAGSQQYGQLVVQYYYDAFVETPDSIPMIREWVQKDGRS